MKIKPAYTINVVLKQQYHHLTQYTLNLFITVNETDSKRRNHIFFADKSQPGDKSSYKLQKLKPFWPDIGR